MNHCLETSLFRFLLDIDEILKKQETKVEISASKDLEHEYRSATGVLYSQDSALDVKIGGFTLTAFGRELIKDTMIEFTIGRRYGLIGANGSGKSTFLRTLAAREVPIPDFIDIFHLSHEAAPTTKTAKETVLEATKKEMARLEALADVIMETQGFFFTSSAFLFNFIFRLYDDVLYTYIV